MKSKTGKDILTVVDLVGEGHLHIAVVDGDVCGGADNLGDGVGRHIGCAGYRRAHDVLTAYPCAGVAVEGEADECIARGVKPDPNHNQALMVSICTLV